MTERPADLQEQVEAILDSQVRPYLQSHGGDVALVSIDDRCDGVEVTVAFQAACRHCELRTVTFAATVRARLRTIPSVRTVTCRQVTATAERLDKIEHFFA